VYSDGAGSADGVTLGNNLADYVDAGGGVVPVVFITASIPLTGRFNGANYYIIQPTAQQSGSQQTLGAVYLPGDPLLVGVTSFNGCTSSYRPSSSSLHPGAVRVADWSGPGTIPLIAKGMINGHPRVDLGFYLRRSMHARISGFRAPMVPASWPMPFSLSPVADLSCRRYNRSRWWYFRLG
jgi:hypothetical protein